MNESIKNSMTDLVPIFLRGRHLILTQNTENVTKTNDLGNEFTLVGGYHKGTVNGSASIMYDSAGGVMSLQDLNN